MNFFVTIALLFAGFVLMSNGQSTNRPTTKFQFVFPTPNRASTTRLPSMPSTTMRPVLSQSTTGGLPNMPSTTMRPVLLQSTTRFQFVFPTPNRASTTRLTNLASTTMRPFFPQSTTGLPNMPSTTMRPVLSQSTTKFQFVFPTPNRPSTTRLPNMPSTTILPQSTTRYPYVPTTTRPISAPLSSVRPQTSTLINLPTTGVPKTTPNNLPPPINGNPDIPCGYNIYTENNNASSGSRQRIVGGVEARINEFPYQVRISFNGRFLCGGSIISNHHILTAAHCVNNGAPPSSFIVVLGNHNRSVLEPGEVAYNIAKVIVHPKRDASTKVFDFAILVTAPNITFDRKAVRPVCLPDTSLATDALVGQSGIISGWGSTYENSQLSTVLQKATVPIWPQGDCIFSYGTMITTDMMCAGYKAGGIDACQGDSGGPLVTIASNGRYYLQGVTSWGAGCANRSFPGVYARVASVIDWIKSTMASS